MSIIQHSPQALNFGVVAPGHSNGSGATFRIPTEASVTVGITNDTSGNGFHISRVRIYEPVPGSGHLLLPDLELVSETDGTAPFDVVRGDVVEVSVGFTAPVNLSTPVNMVTGILSFRAVPTTAGGRWGALVPLSAEIGREAPKIKTPWAVLLCKWSDDKSEPFERQFYNDLFTSSGSGTMNMVDFFRDASHRLIDVSGTRVFGWLDLNNKKSEYTGSGPNPAGRQALVDWARQAALAQGISLNGYFGVVVVTNVFVDVWGASGEVVSGGNRLQGVVSPSILGQEMGHGYGLAHSREDGSTVDYKDAWDVMSTAGPFMTPNLKNVSIGPSLNAWNMASRGWLDESRVWNSGEPFVPEVAQITLRPLVRYDLPGLLAARVGEYLVEFRVKEGWDAAIPEAAVLVHRFADNHSYIMKAADGRQSLVKGSVFQAGDAGVSVVPWSRVEVLDINAGEQTATVRLIHRRATFGSIGRGMGLDAGRLMGGVANDGGGVMVVDGKTINVPPRSWAHQILVQLASIETSGPATSDPSVDSARHAALAAIAGHVEAQLGSARASTDGAGQLMRGANQQRHVQSEGSKRQKLVASRAKKKLKIA